MRALISTWRNGNTPLPPHKSYLQIARKGRTASFKNPNSPKCTWAHAKLRQKSHSDRSGITDKKNQGLVGFCLIDLRSPSLPQPLHVHSSQVPPDSGSFTYHNSYYSYKRVLERQLLLQRELPTDVFPPSAFEQTRCLTPSTVPNFTSSFFTPANTAWNKFKCNKIALP